MRATKLLIGALLFLLPGTAVSETIHLTFDAEAFFWEEVTPGVFRSALRSEPSLNVPGSFDLPGVPVSILPPQGTRLRSIRILDSAFQTVEAPGRIARYAEDAAEPKAWPALVQQLHGGYHRGRAVDGAMVVPVQPMGSSIALYTELLLEVEFEPDRRMDSVVPLRGRRELISPHPEAGHALHRDANPVLVAEPQGPQRFSPRHRPSLDGSAVPYVIVTVEDFTEAFEPLARWRTQTGLPAVIRTMEWITGTYPGVDSAERLRNFIIEAVRYWGAEYVLLGGDNPHIPIRYATTTFYGGATIPSDLYFQCLDGNWNANGNADFGEAGAAAINDLADIVPDVWLGRLPAQNESEVTVMVDKILAHEQLDDPSQRTGLILAEVLFPKDWDPELTAYVDGADLGEVITEKLEDREYEVRRLYENHEAFAGARIETLTTVLEELNAGAGVVLHVGHGSYLSMSVGRGGRTLTRPIVGGLTNTGKEFFLYSVNCTSAALDFDAIGKHFLRNPLGGAVGSVGSTRFDFPGASDPYDRGFFDSAVTENMTVGEALANAKVVHLEAAQLESAARWTTMTIVLMSDPALRLKNSDTRTFTPTVDTDVAQGDALTVTVESEGAPVEGARVVVFEPEGFWASQLTGSDGQTSFVMSTADTGQVTVSVVSPGFLAWQQSVRVTPSEAGLPVVAGTSVEGANEGCLQAGKFQSVRWDIVNAGGESLSGVALEVQGPWEFSYLSGPSTLEPGETGEFSFGVTVPGSVEDLETVSTELHLESDQGSWVLQTSLHVGAPELGIYELRLQELLGDGDALVEDGEEFTLDVALINTGTGPALAEDVVLTPVRDGEVLAGSVAVDSIPSGAVHWVEGFTVRAHSSHPLFALHYGSTAILQGMDLSAPDPPGVAGTTGGTNAITLTWDPSDSGDVVRYVVASGEASEGPFERISSWGHSASAMYEDSPLPDLTVRYYVLAAQDSSGNLSAFSSSIRATTGLAQVSGFPLDCGAETGTSPVVADVDGDGAWEIITGGLQVYVLRADGSELIDGDNDVRNQGVFSHEDSQAGFFASPAVGDLDGDGRLEIVAVMAQQGFLLVWDAKGELLPGWPQKIETRDGTVWVQSSPTLFDFDNDGDLEIALHGNDAVHVFHHDGTEFLDGDENPATQGVFYVTGAFYTYTSPAARDLDDDGAEELIVAARNGGLYVFEDDGSVWPGFPVQFGGELTSSPAVADLDGDGAPEILLGSGGQNSVGPDSVEVRRLDGSSLPGWPQPALMNQDISSSPAVADWDNDGDLEVCLVSGNTTIYLWNADGTLVEGFPIQFFDSLGNVMSARGSPAIQNLDGDPDLEAAFTNQAGWLYGINYDGTLVEGFPIKHAGGIEGCPLIFDLNNDGFNELCVTGLDAQINLYRTPGVTSERPGWPMFQGNPRHTGNPETGFKGRAFSTTLSILQSPHLPQEATAYLVPTVSLGPLPLVRLDGEALLVREAGSAPPLYGSAFSLSAGVHTLETEAISVYGDTARVLREFEVLSTAGSSSWTSSSQGVRVSGEALHDPLMIMKATGAPGWGEPPLAQGLRYLIGIPGQRPRSTALLEFEVDPRWKYGAVERWNGHAWERARHIGADSGSLTIEVEAWGWYRLAQADRPVPLFPVLELRGPRPNPTPGAATFQLHLSRQDHLRLTVHDIQGRTVSVMEDRVFSGGDHVVAWDGRDQQGRQATAGVYFLRVQGRHHVLSRRIVRLPGGTSP